MLLAGGKAAHAVILTQTQSFSFERSFDGSFSETFGSLTFALTLLGTGDEGCFSECESGAGTDWSGTIAVAYTYNVPGAAVAEPAALALAGAALAGLAFARPARYSMIRVSNRVARPRIP